MAKLIANKQFQPNWQPMYGTTVPTSDVFGGQRAPGKFDLVAAFSDMVYAATMLRQRRVAKSKINLYVKTNAGQRKARCATAPVSRKTYDRVAKSLPYGTKVEQVLDSPLLDLLRRANSSNHNQSDILGYTSLYLDVVGNSYLLMEEDATGLPCELSILEAQHVTPIRESQFKISGYTYGAGNQEVHYKPSDIIHFREPNLADPYGEGYSPLQAAWQRVMISAKEMGYLDNVLTNQGRPDSIISISEGMFPDEAERLQKEFFQRYRGAGSGGPLFIDGKMSFAPLAWQPTDLAQLSLFQVLKNVICNIFGIPPDVFELSNGNRASAETILFQLAEDCVAPRLHSIVEKLNDRVCPLFDDRLFFAADDVVPEDKAFALQKLQAAAAAGAVTRQEWREEIGYEPAEWAAEPLLPSGMMPAPLPSTQDTAAVELPAVQPSQEQLNARAAAISALQASVYTGQVPRSAAIANAVFSLGMTPDQATALFPEEVKQHQEQEQHQAEAAAPQASEGDGEPATAEQAPAAAANDLRATVGGSVAVGDLQRSYYRQELPREAAIANAVLIFGFTEAEAATLFPELAPNAPQAVAAPQQAPEAPPGPAEAPAQPAPPEKAVKGLKAPQKLSPETLEKAVGQFLSRQAAEVLGRLKELDPSEAITKAIGPGWFDVEVWTKDMARELIPSVAIYYEHAAKETVTRLGASPDLFNVVQPNLKEGVEKATLAFCKETQETTSLELGEALTKLKQEIATGLIEGDVKNAMMERVQKVFTGADNYRAFRIGATEANRAQHAAVEITARESGLATGKKWILSDDACELCKPLAGKVVPLGENFLQEGSGPYSSIPYPPRHPMCRCAMVETIEGVND